MKTSLRFTLVIIIGILLALSLSRTIRSQSSMLDTCLAGMTAGTWQRCTTIESTLSADMVYPGPSDGGLSFTNLGFWDPSAHVGYWWSGEHSSAAVCNPITTEAACAANSQRFIKYTDATNSFSEPLDTGNMSEMLGRDNPNDGHSGDQGLHPNSWGAINLSNGDVYRVWNNKPQGYVMRYDHVDHTWHTMHALPTANNASDSGIGWFPEASRLISVNGQGTVGALATGIGVLYAYDPANDAAGWPVINGDLNGSPSTNFEQLKMAYIETVAVYNPILHEMLVGSGSGATAGGVNFNDHFRILTYTGGTFHLSADRSISSGSGAPPSFNMCGNATVDGQGFPVWTPRFENSSQWSITTVDPVSGQYIFLMRDGSCVGSFWHYNSITDFWTKESGGKTPPDPLGGAFGLGSNGSGSGSGASSGSSPCEVASMIDKGALMMNCGNGPTSTPVGNVWLYKADAGGGGGTPPSVPTGLTNTAKTAITAELHVTGNETVGSAAFAGWKWRRNGVLVATTNVPWFNNTGLSPGTTYTFDVASYGVDNATSAFTSTISVTTDTQLLTFNQKCARTGVIHCDGLNVGTLSSSTDFYWDSPSVSGSFPATPCDATMTGLGYTDNVHSILDDGYTGAVFKATAIAQSNTCSYPIIDTSIKHSGTGSLKFPIINHSNQAFSGEYYGAFHKYADGHFGYIGPANSGGGTPSTTAVQEGTELWMQYYIRADHTLLQTAFPVTYTGNNAGLGNYTFTVSSAAPTHVIAHGSMCPGGPGGIPAGLAGKQMLFGSGTNFTLGTSFTISSVDSDGCGVVLALNPSAGLDAGSPDPGVPWVSGGSDASGWKNVGLFGNPRPGINTCCVGGFQGSISNSQWGLPAMYSYNQAGGVMDYQTGSPPLLNYAQNMRGWIDAASVQHGAVFNTSHGLLADPNAIFYPDPPALRYPIDDFAEITIHIVLSAADLSYTLSHSNTCPDASNRLNYHTLYEMWVNGKKAWTMPNFVHCWGTTSLGGGSSNGLGLFNFSPYMTFTDPNFSHTDTAFWVDDIIVSTQPIPMLSNVTDPCEGPWSIVNQEPSTCVPYPGGLYTKQLPNAGAGGPVNHLLGNTGSSAASDAMVALLTGEVGQTLTMKYTIGNGVTANPGGTNTGGYSFADSGPVYYGNASDTIWQITNCTGTGAECKDDMVNGFQFHVPANARFSHLTAEGAGDSTFYLWDQVTNEIIVFHTNDDMGVPLYNKRKFTPCGSPPCSLDMSFLSGSAHKRNTLPDYNVPNPFSSLKSAPMSTQVRTSELLAGVINHALEINSKCTRDDDAGFVFPSPNLSTLGCSSIPTSNTNRPHQGQLFFLGKTDAQIAALSVPPYQKIFLTALAHYGAYYSDTSGGATMDVFEREGNEAYETASISPGPFFTWATANSIGCSGGGGTTDAPTNTCTISPFAGLPAGWANDLHVADPCVPLGLAGLAGGCTDLLSFTVQPTNITSGGVFSPTVTVTALLNGVPDTAFANGITLTISGCGAAATGTLTRTPSSGAAVFSGLGATGSAINCTFTASATDAGSATSNAFDVVSTCTPDHLIFTAQPSNALIGASLGAVRVAVVNAAGSECGTDTSTITITNKIGTCTGMSLGGTTVGANALSVSNLTESAAGSCALHAIDGVLGPVDSNVFTITAPASTTSSRIRFH